MRTAVLVSIRVLALGVSLVTLSALSGCTRHSASKPAAGGQLPTGQRLLKVGDSHPVFSFDSSRVTELTIAKEDPVTGDHWMARMQRQQEKPGLFYKDDPWRIVSYSDSSNLPDRLANRNFIFHLLDTLRTYRALGLVKQSGTSDAVRSSYGLNPPRYALRWRAWDSQSGKTRQFQAVIGNPVNPDDPESKESYGMFPPDQHIYKVDGAALAMLEYLKTFKSLREIVLSPVTADWTDEIMIDRGGHEVLYAQRDGNRWADAKHRPWKSDVEGFLQRITHLRIEKFLDHRTSMKLEPLLEKHPLARITLRGRHGKEVSFRFARSHGRELADVSTRGHAVFQLYPTALSRLQP